MIELKFVETEPSELRSLVLSGLKSFIGLTADEIRTYWKTFGIEEALISEGTWDDTGEPYLVIHYSDLGTPEFSVTFKNGLCVSQSMSVEPESVPKCINFLRDLGFSYEPKLRRYTKAQADHVWRIQRRAGNNYSLIARSLLKKVCESVQFSELTQ